jgi:hypothetical protein
LLLVALSIAGLGQRGRRGRWGRDVEDCCIGGTKVEHRGRPFHSARAGEHRGPGLRQRRVDGEAVGQRGVELGRQNDRRVVGDLELHRDDGVDPASKEVLRDAGERIGGVCPCAFARVQDRELQRLVVLEERPQGLGAHGVALPLRVLEKQHPFLASWVVAAVPDEVEGVVRVQAKPALQLLQGAAFHPVDRDEPVLDEATQRLFDLRALELDVQIERVARSADRDEDPQRGGDRDRLDRSAEILIANHG